MKKSLSLFIIITAILSYSIAFAQEPETGTPPAADAESPLSGIVSDGFTLVPAYPNSVNSRKFIYELKPGDTYTDYVLVKNLSSQTTTYMLYGADPTLTNMGTPAYKTRENGITAEGAWIKFAEPEVTLKSQQEKLLGFTVSVPKDTPPGDYRAGITMEKTKKDAKNTNVTIATRVILHANIKVTNNPGIVPREQEPPQAEKEIVWHPYYLWITLTLFVLSIAGLLWTSSAEKKARREANKAPHPKKRPPRKSRK
jgi:hypothetical protein